MSEDIKNYVEEMGRTFEEFKATMNERLAQVESKGSVDPVTESKLQNVERDLDKLEDFNQKLTKQELEFKQIGEKLDRFETMLKRPNTNIDGKQVDQKMAAFDAYLRKGENGLSPDEMKTLTVGDNTAAGYLAPPEYVRELVKTIEEISPMRSLARIRPTTQKSIQIPQRTATFAAQWVTETGTRSETTGYTTAQEEIFSHELYALVDISEQLTEDSVFNLEAEMQGEFATQFAKAEGAKFINGTGSGQPEGILTNADVGTTNSGSASALTGDGLIDLMHALKSDYGRNGTFIFNRTTLAAIRKLQDTAGQYVFQAGMSLQAGIPNTILGAPYVEMPDMPDIAAAAKPVAFGDFSRGYLIVDRVNISILRDPFTQATSGSIRYYARKRVGGAVILAEAIRTQTIAA